MNLQRTPAGNIEANDGTYRLIHELEAMAIERDRIVLRAQVRALPTKCINDRLFKEGVLHLIGDVTTDRLGSGQVAPEPEQSAAAANNSEERVPRADGLRAL